MRVSLIRQSLTCVDMGDDANVSNPLRIRDLRGALENLQTAAATRTAARESQREQSKMLKYSHVARERSATI